MKKERLLILDLDHEILAFDVLDLNTFKKIIEAHDEYSSYVYLDKRNVTLKWYGEDAVYYYQINDDGNVVLRDLIAR